MNDRSDATEHGDAPIERVRPCGSYTPGHDVHYIQARKSGEAGAGQAAHIVSVDDDGTITFADGTTLWNHDPDRLRGLLERHGFDVRLCAYGVMKLPHDATAYCFCVAPAATPCPGPVGPPESFEDVVRQVAERGGVMISGQELLRLAEERRGGKSARERR
jgi:hypothetical protein